MLESPAAGSNYHQAVLEDDNTRHLLRVFIWLSLGGSLLYFLALPFSTDHALVRGAGVLAADLCFMAAYYLLERGRTAAAANLLIWGAWGAMFIQVSISNGLLSRTLIFAPIVVVLAAWLLTARGAVVLCAATLLAGLAIALAERTGLLPLLVSSTPPLLVWLAFSIYVTLAGAVAYHIFRGFRLRHEALARREAELNLLMESVPSMIFHGDRDTRCLYANRAYAEFYSAGKQRPIGKTVREIVGEEAYRGVGERLRRVIAGERQIYRAVRPSPRGEPRTLDVDLLPEFGDGGAAKGLFAVINDVTENVRAEEELRRSEEKFASVFRSSPLAVAITRLEDGRYLDVNEAFARLFGWTREETIGRTSLELGKWATPGARTAWAAALKRDGRVTNLETDFRNRNGDIRRVLLSAELIEIAGEPCALVMTTDITERLRAEEKFAKVFRASPVSISISRIRDGLYLDVNDAFVEQFGWTRDEFIGHTSVEIGIWPDPAARNRFVAELQQSGRIKDLDAVLNAKSGRQRSVLISAERIVLEDEECLIGMVHDITERLETEAALRASEARLRMATAAGSVGIWEWDVPTGRLTWNVQLKAIFGLAADTENLTLERFVAAIHPDDSGRVQHDFMLALDARGEFNCEYRIVRPSGVIRWIVARGLGQYDEAGGPQRMVGTAIDVTERREAEAALRASEERLREAQRIGHVGSWELDFSSRRLLWSDEIYRIYEMAPGSFSGKFQDLIERIHPDDRQRISDLYRNSACVAGSHDMEHRILTPGGQVRHMRIHWEMFLDEAGMPLRAIGTAQDITEHLQAQLEIQRLNDELELRVRERTAQLSAANRELESFAYSISHDLRAPLRGIDGFTHLLAEEYGGQFDEQGRGYLDRVRRAAQRMGELIDDILELSRVTRQGMRRLRVDLSELAREILDERARSRPDNLLLAEVADGCAAVGDPQLLRVLMQNLLENAWKYSAKRPDPYIEFGCVPESGETVFFVRDNGVGFDMKYADRLFAPFQRLHKPEDFEGTGIGLATVARIVHRHGGRVWAEAVAGQGAVFKFTLGQPQAQDSM